MFFWLFPAIDLSGRQAALAEKPKNNRRCMKVQVQIKPVVDRLRNLQEKHPEIKKDTSEPDPLQTAKLDTPTITSGKRSSRLMPCPPSWIRRRTRPAWPRWRTSSRCSVDWPPSRRRRLWWAVVQVAGSRATSRRPSRRSSNSQELNKEPKSAEDKARAEQLRQELKRCPDQLGKIAESTDKIKDQLRQMNLSQEEVSKLIDKLNKGDLNAIAKQLADKGHDQGAGRKGHEASGEIRRGSQGCQPSLAQALAKAASQQDNKPGEQEPAGPAEPAGPCRPERSAARFRRGQKDQQGQKGAVRARKSGRRGAGSTGRSAGWRTADGFTAGPGQFSEMESLQQQMAELNSRHRRVEGPQGTLGLCGGDGGDGRSRSSVVTGMGLPASAKAGSLKNRRTAFGVTPERVSRAHDGRRDHRSAVCSGRAIQGEVTSEFVEAALGAGRGFDGCNRRRPASAHQLRAG